MGHQVVCGEEEHKSVPILHSGILSKGRPQEGWGEEEAPHEQLKKWNKQMATSVALVCTYKNPSASSTQIVF